MLKVTKEHIKKYSAYAIVALAFTPQVLFALGKPELALAVQGLIKALGLNQVEPGIVQGALASAASVVLAKNNPDV